MLTGGFIAAIAAVIVVLICVLSNLNMFSDLAAMGLGKWLDYFFATITAQKVCFFIAVVVFIIGVYCYFAGKAKAKKAGEETRFVPTPIAKYFRDTKGEFKKITWPTFSAVVRNTGVTLAVCAVLGLVICLIDFGLGALIELLLKIGG